MQFLRSIHNMNCLNTAKSEPTDDKNGKFSPKKQNKNDVFSSKKQNPIYVEKVKMLSNNEEKNAADIETISYKEPSGNHSNSKWSCLLLVVACVTCLSAVVLTFVLLWFYTQGPPQDFNKPQSFVSTPVCLQCVKLIKNPFNQLEADELVDKLTKRVDDGIQMCCAENGQQLSSLLQAIGRSQAKRSIPAPSTADGRHKFTPVSAHKQVLPNDERNKTLTEPLFSDGSTHFIVRFNTETHDHVTEHARGITVLDTALEIRHTGFYYVYLSVYMAPSFEKPLKPPKHKVWNQYVHRISPNDPASTNVLMQTAHTPCSDYTHHKESAFVGGTFYLKEGDRLEVCLSGLGLVDYKKESSFLGLVMLSSGTDTAELSL